MVVAGARARMARITSAKCCAPPSARSSRSTEVMTTCARPSFSTASATLSGSCGSSAPRQAGLDVAEGASARAGVAHDHEGGVLLLPALADIGAARLLADRDELVLAHDAVASRPISASPAPLTRIQSGLRWNGLVRPVRLFRMARARIVVQEVENDGHGNSWAYSEAKAALFLGGLLAVVFKRQLMLLDFVVQRLLRQPERLASRSNTSILLTQFVLNQAALELAHLVGQRGRRIRRPA